VSQREQELAQRVENAVIQIDALGMVERLIEA
jgi:hypothetical protein